MRLTLRCGENEEERESNIQPNSVSGFLMNHTLSTGYTKLMTFQPTLVYTAPSKQNYSMISYNCIQRQYVHFIARINMQIQISFLLIHQSSLLTDC